jgi:spore maturation protein CgeB
MGSGVFVLSHDYKEIEKEFTPGEHLDIFTDYEDLKSKINYYLANDGVREAIALKGYNHVHINHTWDNRINELLNKI